MTKTDNKDQTLFGKSNAGPIVGQSTTSLFGNAAANAPAGNGLLGSSLNANPQPAPSTGLFG